jgi:murein DD-endopeptidase MepM/ murein hydrolase activator NlpD
MPGLPLPNLSWTFPLPKDKAAPQSRWTLDQGVDIAAPAHTPLYAVGSGTIVRHGIPGFGDDAPVLKLDGNRGYVYYGHAGPGNAVKLGTHVNAGDVIGEVGAGRVGISTGPHLEIGLANATGNPIGRSTASTVKTFLTGANDPGGSVLPSIPNPVTAAENAAASAAKTAVTGVLGDLWNTIAGKAEYAGLFLLLILAGVGLAVFGLTRAAGRHPQEATV